MPRLARLDAPGALHHIMIRGIERRNIFKDNRDRDSFIQRLGDLLLETQTDCYAWVLMPNHAHFLFRTGGGSLASVMRRLLTGYALSFNGRHRRHGHLFQNRYKSIICQEDAYLRELVRYIHLNPLRGKTVSSLTELATYPYCGHSALMGKRKREWQNTHYVLDYFGRTFREARKNYLSYVEVGIEQGRREDLVGGGLIRSLGGWTEIKKLRLARGDRLRGDERILGDSDFVSTVLSGADERYTRRYELKRLGYDLDKIADRVGMIYGIDKRYVLSKGRQGLRVDARSLLCYWAVRELGMTLTELARSFGMTPSAVGYSAQRGEIIATENKYELTG